MKNKSIYIFFSALILAIFWLSLRGLMKEQHTPVVYDMPVVGHRPAVFPKWKDETVVDLNKPSFRIPAVGRDFVGFKEALAFNESGRRYHIINKLGYLGKYQFGMGTLRALNMNVTYKEFLKNPQLQEEAFKRYVKENRKILAKEIKRYNGRYLKGIKITESGILAAAHLAGAGAVQKFLRSGGKESSTDAFGTRVEDYLQRFSGYDLSEIR